MSNIDSKILQIYLLICLIIQVAIAGVGNDLNNKDEFEDVRLLQVFNPNLQSKIDKAVKNPAFEDPVFADPEFCYTEDLTSLNTLKPDDIVKPLNADLTLEESKRFLKYFQDEYNSNSSIMDCPNFCNYSDLKPSQIIVNHISLAENRVDDDFVTVILHESTSMSSTRIKTYFTTKKENIVRDSKWIYDFTLNDDFAFCYFCNSNSLKSQLCRIRFEAITTGARNTIELKSQFYVAMVDSDGFTVLTAKLDGGPMAKLNTIYRILLALYLWILPYSIGIININYLATQDPSKPKRLSLVGYCISSLMANSYHLYIAISIICLNSKYRTPEGKPVASTFYLIGWILLVVLLALFSNGFLSEEAWERKQKLNNCILSIHAAFYCITIPLVFTVLAPFMLHTVYMRPTIYFLLGNIHIIPIVMSAVGRVTVNNYFACILLSGIFYGIFPFLTCGPGFWTDGFDLKWFCLFMLLQIFYAAIVGLQQFKGSRFCCPSKYRIHSYSKFKYNLDTDPLDETTVCNLCLNSIYDVELEYKDANKNYKYIDFGSNCYLKVECGHIFHPNCLIRRIGLKNECPICRAELPPSEFED